MSKDDWMLVRLCRLPPRLRVAHLMALLRWERSINAGELSRSYPSPAERVGREGRGEAEARVGGILLYPHPDAHFIRVDPPRKGEGSDASNTSRRDGHHG